ncbi:MAG: hypothetical protein QF535_09595, partial [Anaerolineales bacterium]|nr:hypothetical protein [Anaerolineales bacterium]
MAPDAADQAEFSAATYANTVGETWVNTDIPNALNVVYNNYQPGAAATEIEIAWTVSANDFHTYEYTFPEEMLVTGSFTSKEFCDGSLNSCKIRLVVFSHADVDSGTALGSTYYE